MPGSSSLARLPPRSPGRWAVTSSQKRCRTATPDQPDQAVGCFPEPRVLQEADDAALDGNHPEGHLLRRGSSGARCPAAGIQEIYAVLAANEDRNMLSFDDVLKSLEEGRSPILLTERKDHLDLLAERFRKFTRHLVVLKGGLTARKRKEAMERLASIPCDEERLVLATGRYIGEGFDDTRLDTLFLTLPVSWKGTLVQYAGRLHRHRPGKREVRIYDYVDRNVPILARMAEGGSKPPVVDEFDDREEIVEPILQGRPGEDQGEARAQPLDDAAGLRLTVLDRSRPRRRCRPSGRAADRRQEAFGEADGMPGLCGSAR